MTTDCPLGVKTPRGAISGPLANRLAFNTNAMRLPSNGTVMVGGLLRERWWCPTPGAAGSYVNKTWSQPAVGPNNPNTFRIGGALRSASPKSQRGGQLLQQCVDIVESIL